MTIEANVILKSCISEGWTWWFFWCSFLAVEEPGSASAQQPKIEERIRRLESEIHAIVKPQLPIPSPPCWQVLQHPELRFRKQYSHTLQTRKIPSLESNPTQGHRLLYGSIIPGTQLVSPSAKSMYVSAEFRYNSQRKFLQIMTWANNLKTGDLKASFPWISTWRIGSLKRS
jgi:hypothetical protein